MILSGCLFLVYFCSCTVHSQTRASVLYCLLSQTDRSLDSQTPPAIAGSLLVDDARKTNAAFSAALVFLLRSSHAYSLCDLGHFGFV